MCEVVLAWCGFDMDRAKKCIRTCAKCADSDHPAHAQSIIRAFVLNSYNLRYPMILLADSEGPDQTSQAVLGFRCLYMPEDSFSHSMAHMMSR